MQDLYKEITVLEDIQFLLKHAPRIFPESCDQIDGAQVKARLYELREQLRQERIAAIEVRPRCRLHLQPPPTPPPLASPPQTLAAALRAFYSDRDPDDVQRAAEYVAKRFKVRFPCSGGPAWVPTPTPPPQRVEEIKKLAADCHKHFPSEFASISATSVRDSFVEEQQAATAVLAATGKTART